MKGGHFRVPFLGCLNEIPGEIPWTHKFIRSWSRFRTALLRPQDPADHRLQTLNKTLVPETPTRTTVAARGRRRWLVPQCDDTVQRANPAARRPLGRPRQRTSAVGRCPVGSDGGVIPGITTRAKRAAPQDYAPRVPISIIWCSVTGIICRNDSCLELSPHARTRRFGIRWQRFHTSQRRACLHRVPATGPGRLAVA